MKKLGIVLVVLILIGVGGYFAYQQYGLPVLQVMEKRSAIHLIGADAAAFYKGAPGSEDLKQTQFYQALTGYDWQGTLDKVKTSLEEQYPDQPDIVVNIERAEQVVNSPLWPMIFTPEASSVFYPINEVDFELISGDDNLAFFDVMAVVLGKFVHIAPANTEIQLLDKFSGVFEQFSVDVDVTEKQYREYTYKSLAIPDSTFSIDYVIADEYLIISVGDWGLKKTLDVFDEVTPDFTTTDAYQRLTSLPSDGDSLMYVNVEPFSTMVRQYMRQAWERSEQQREGMLDEQTQAMVEQQKRAFESALDNMFWMKAIYAKSNTMDVQGHMYAQMDVASTIDDFTRYTVACEADQPAILDYVSPSILFVNWNGCASIERMVKYQKETAPTTDPEGLAQMQAVFETVSAQLGVDLETELLPALGDQTFFAAEGFDLSGQFPLPKIVLGVEVQDRTVIDGILNEQTSKMGMAFVEEEYEGHTIRSITLPFVPGLQPGYAYLDNIFVLTTSKSLIEQMIDVKTGKADSLETNALFDRTVLKVDESSSITFVRIGAAAQTYIDLYGWAENWYNSMAGMQQQSIVQIETSIADVDELIADNAQQMEAMQEGGLDMMEEGSEDIPTLASLEAKAQQLQDQREQMVAAHEGVKQRVAQMAMVKEVMGTYVVPILEILVHAGESLSLGSSEGDHVVYDQVSFVE